MAAGSTAWARALEGFKNTSQQVRESVSTVTVGVGLGGRHADIGISGREVMLIEYLSFDETFGYDPVTISIATGAADSRAARGRGHFVNKDNPIKGSP